MFYQTIFFKNLGVFSRRKNLADISCTSRVIAYFVPNSVAMATREGPG